MTTLPILNCDDCGHCCLGQGAGPFLPWELPHLPLDLQTRRRAYAMAGGYKDALSGVPRAEMDWCMFFDQQTKRCSIYDIRPEICREFEMGGEDCLRIRSESIAGGTGK